MKTTLGTFLLSILLLSISCTPDEDVYEKVNYEIGWFPQSPKNIVEFNTIYDDYNSDINFIGENIDYYYSTNRESQGANFDITNRRISAGVDLDRDEFHFEVKDFGSNYSNVLLPMINTPFDEYGPFAFYGDSAHNYSTMWYFFYANNESGDFDIQFAYTSVGDWGSWNSNREILGPFKANVLNSENDDYYPTINANHTQLFFSSNREASFDIYEVEMDFENIVDWLQDGTSLAQKNTTLSSTGDDKCPYIKGNLMVFASNNSNGFGGFDLWYSMLINGEWSSPQNFGAQINSEYDEFRPAIEHIPESNNDFMVFSSNRPGGKGGFDLYYVGIDKMIVKRP